MNGHLDPEYISKLESQANYLWQKVRRYRYPYNANDACSFMLDHRPFYPNEGELEMVTRSSGDFQHMTACFVAIQ